MPFPLQAPNATKQDSVVVVLEWLRKLEAAEALLVLKNSSQDPCDSSSLQHHGSMPGSCLLQDGAWGMGHWKTRKVVLNWLW